LYVARICRDHLCPFFVQDLDLSLSFGETLYYSIVANNPSNAFAIDQATGQLTIPSASNPAVQMPANKIPPQYSMTLAVQDAGIRGPAQRAYVNITVNITETFFPPVLTPYSFLIPELSTNGTQIGTVSATSLSLSSLLTLSYTLAPTMYYPSFPFTLTTLPLGPGGNMVGVITVAQGVSVNTFSDGPQVRHAAATERTTVLFDYSEECKERLRD
jgi:hypothetical protein